MDTTDLLDSIRPPRARPPSGGYDRRTFRINVTGPGRAAPFQLDEALAQWQVQIGTAYGYWQMMVDHAVLDAVGRFIDAYRRKAPGRRVPRPLWAWLEQTRLPAASSGSVLLDSASASFLLPRLVDVCDGVAQCSESLASGPLSHTAWRALGNGRRAPEEVRPTPDSSPPRVAVPDLTDHGLFGGRDLVAALVSAIGPAEPAGSAFDHFAAHAAAGATSPADLRHTFACLADYALASPLHPRLAPLTTVTPWRDRHPGWRFLRLCESLAQFGPLANDSDTLDEDRYRRFVARIESVTGWPTPLQVAEAFLSGLTVRREMGWPSALFASACALRLESPTSLLSDPSGPTGPLRRRDRGLARPPVYHLDQSVELAGWPAASEAERFEMTSDLTVLAAAYQVADFLAHDGGGWSGLELEAFADADQLLTKLWGVTAADFRRLPK